MPRHRHRRRTISTDADDALNVSDLHAATDEVSFDTEWTRIQELLSGLLDIVVDPHYQTEAHHTQSSWLIVYITHVKPPNPQAKNALAKRMEAALNAVATLCVAAERLRLRASVHLAFWTRILTSQMMANPLDSNDVGILWFAQHTREREMRIKLHWTNRKIEKGLLAPLKTFLHSQWQDSPRLVVGDRTLRLRSMKIGICLQQTYLTVKEIDLLADLLAPTEEDNGMFLFQNTIASLDFRYINLRHDVLRALASRVYPRARPIDQLLLEAIFPAGPLGDPSLVLTPEYETAFKSVLMAAFDAKYCGGVCRPVSLSLAYNRLQTMHFQALFDALHSATRDLTILSLKYTIDIGCDDSPKLGQGILKALEAITFKTANPSGRIDQDCELDLTGAVLTENEPVVFLQALADRVKRSLSLVQGSFAKGGRVTCQVMEGVVAEEVEGREEDVNLNVNVDYTVVSVPEEGDIRIVVPATDDEATSTGKILPTDIVALAIGGKVLLQSRFNRLVLDGDVDNRVKDYTRAWTRACGCAIVKLIEPFAPRLTHLSLRSYRCWHRYRLHQLMGGCTHLEHLALEESTSLVRESTEWIEITGALKRLKTLNLCSTQATSTIIQNVVNALAQTPNLPLQRLSLTQNQLSIQNLEQIQLLLDVHPSIQLLELDSIGSSDNVEAYIAVRRDLTRDYHNVIVETKPTSTPTKLTLLSVVRSLCPGHNSVEPTVLHSLFEMANEVIPRQILWRGSK